MDRQQLWWAQPGPANVIGKIVLSVARKRRAICISAPQPRPAGFSAAIERRLRAELSLECVTINVADQDQSQAIPHLLAGLLNVPAVEIGSVSDFASHPNLVDEVLIVDGVERVHLRRWSLFLRQLLAEPVGEALVGPIVLLLLPVGLSREELASLCGPAEVISTLGMTDRYDCASYIAGIGGRPTQDLLSRVGHAATIEVAAWSREMIEKMFVWDPADQIDPLPLLAREATGSNLLYPCWENGLVDYWDDEPAAHPVAAVKHGLEDHVRRRLWTAQASVLLPFTHRILRSLISKYRHVLAKKISPRTPLRKDINGRRFEITDFWKIEFYDFRTHTEHLLTPQEADLVKIAAWTRNKVAHKDLIDSNGITLFSEHYEANRETLDCDIPGWNWPRCGQTMTLTVGPSGAGKSRWSAEQGIDVVSSDEIRKEHSSDGELPGDQSDVFHRVRSRSSRLLGEGRDVIVDAMHVEPEHRLRQVSIAPPDLKVRYVIIDRPLEEKQRDAGWRAKKGVVEQYHATFTAQLPAALNGDGRQDIQVVDLRSRGGTSAQ
ncbi:ATP-binding protein [Bradyrhizobium australafricanum]|uniref:ATP-binding protein n=1 Tax=Bradyrhizobium australafricanum TaxID=2821406 RepID=UPI001CE2D36A|nr:ATP-binding protein [Bradyrhizobium australafricanum]MCA6101602.1 ATP-binding protein [Bradyrhizobium australafricanum]